MRLIFIGAPGSGKGTQADRLCAKLNIPHAHLSVKYMDSYTFPKSAKINISGDGDVVVADTQDSNPVKWDLCYYVD